MKILQTGSGNTGFESSSKNLKTPPMFERFSRSQRSFFILALLIVAFSMTVSAEKMVEDSRYKIECDQSEYHFLQGYHNVYCNVTNKLNVPKNLVVKQFLENDNSITLINGTLIGCSKCNLNTISADVVSETRAGKSYANRFKMDSFPANDTAQLKLLYYSDGLSRNEFWLSVSERLIDYNLTITPTSYLSLYSYRADSSDSVIYFRNNSNTDGAIRFEKDGYYFTYDLSSGQELWKAKTGQPAASDTLGSGVSSNTQNTQVTYSGNNVLYSNAYSNTDITYTLTNGMIKENYVLRSLPSIKDYLYLEYSGNIKFNKSLMICANSVCYVPSGTQDDFTTSGRIDFKDASNVTKFYLSEPIITDSAGHSTLGVYVVHGSNAQMQFYLRIPTSFIQSATFPIYADPTISSVIDDTPLELDPLITGCYNSTYGEEREDSTTCDGVFSGTDTCAKSYDEDWTTKATCGVGEACDIYIEYNRNPAANNATIDLKGAIPSGTQEMQIQFWNYTSLAYTPTYTCNIGGTIGTCSISVPSDALSSQGRLKTKHMLVNAGGTTRSLYEANVTYGLDGSTLVCFSNTFTGNTINTSLNLLVYQATLDARNAADVGLDINANGWINITTSTLYGSHVCPSSYSEGSIKINSSSNNVLINGSTLNADGCTGAQVNGQTGYCKIAAQKDVTIRGSSISCQGSANNPQNTGNCGAGNGGAGYFYLHAGNATINSTSITANGGACNPTYPCYCNGGTGTIKTYVSNKLSIFTSTLSATGAYVTCCGHHQDCDSNGGNSYGEFNAKEFESYSYNVSGTHSQFIFSAGNVNSCQYATNVAGKSYVNFNVVDRIRLDYNTTVNNYLNPTAENYSRITFTGTSDLKALFAGFTILYSKFFLFCPNAVEKIKVDNEYISTQSYFDNTSTCSQGTSSISRSEYFACFSNSDCPSSSYCASDQQCTTDKSHGTACSNASLYVPSNGANSMCADGLCYEGYCNNQPIMSTVAISAGTYNRTDENLACSFTFTDSNNDTAIRNQTRWYNNSVYVSSINNLTTLSNAYTLKGEAWKCSEQVFDGYSWSEWLNSTSLTITNSPPLTPTNLYPDDMVSFSVGYVNFLFSSTDADNWTDTIRYYLYADSNTNPTTLIYNGTATNYNWTGISDGNLYWTVKSGDGTVNSTNTTVRTFTVSSIAPAITLNYPSNNLYFNNLLIPLFNVTATDGNGISSCLLYHNATGIWHQNQSTSSVVSGVAYSFSGINVSDQRTFSWNVWCNDTIGNGQFYTNNFTSGGDSFSPSLTVSSPTGTYTSKTGISLAHVTSDYSLNTCYYNITYTSSGNLHTGNTFVTCNQAATFSVDAYSDYTLAFTVIDKAGNKNSTTKTFTVAEPTTPVVQPSGGGGGTPSQALSNCNVVFDKEVITLDLGKRVDGLVVTNNYIKSVSPSFSVSEYQNVAGSNYVELRRDWAVIEQDQSKTLSILLKNYADNKTINLKLLMQIEGCISKEIPIEISGTQETRFGVIEQGLATLTGFATKSYINDLQVGKVKITVQNWMISLLIFMVSILATVFLGKDTRQKVMLALLINVVGNILLLIIFEVILK